MQRQMRFFPTSSLVTSVPDKISENYEITESGEKRRLRDIVQSYRTVPDLTDRQLLRFYPDDRDIAIDALGWRCGQPGELNFTLAGATRDPDDPELFSFLLPGTLSEDLSPDDVHAICVDYELLRNYFPTYEDIFLLKTADNKFQASVLDWLIMNMETMEGVKPLPPWIKRVIEIRKGN